MLGYEDMGLRRLIQYGGLFRRVFYKGRSLPVYLINFITARCPCRCGHCFNWQRKDAYSDTEMTLDEYGKISRSMGDLAFAFLTGGEPHFREDMPEIARLFYVNNHVIRMQSPTCGWDPDRIVRNVERILQLCPGMQYAQGVSLDGIGDEHDESRRFPGLFNRAVETLKAFKKLREKYPNFGSPVPIAVTAFNQDRVLRLYRYLRDELGIRNVFINYVRGNPRDPETRRLDPQKYCEIAEAVDRDLRGSTMPGYVSVFGHQWYNAKNVITREVVRTVVLEDRMALPCYAARLSGVIYENGDVHPCELIGEPMGNLKQEAYDMKRVWHSAKADELRRRIRKERCRCTHECFLTANILFNPWQLTRCTVIAAQIGLRKTLARQPA